MDSGVFPSCLTSPMSSMPFRFDLFVLDTPSCNGSPGLKMTAKRYTSHFSDPQGLTLLFAHGVSAHKEQWEAMLRYLFLHQNSKQPRSYTIREAWCFDCLNHGDAAIINKAALERRPPGDVSVSEWAVAIASFVRSPHVRDHRLVGFGHSAGNSAIMLSTREFPLRKQPFLALFLIEPTMLTRELREAHLLEEEAVVKMRVNTALHRRNVFDTREEALNHFRERMPWNKLDPDVLNIFIQHGLHPVVIQNGSETEIKFTLKCDRRHEAFAYQDIEGHFEATDQYIRICSTVPAHIVFGTKHDYLAPYFQDWMTDVSQGRYPASVIRVPGTGHMIVQQAPEALANAISVGLNSIARDSTPHLVHRL